MITTINQFKETYTPGEGHKIADKVKQQDIAMLITEWPESKIKSVFDNELNNILSKGYEPRKINGSYTKEIMLKVLQDYFKGKVESGKYSEIKKYFTNPKSNILNEDSNVFDINSLTSLQFYKLIDLLEADITMYDSSDMNYYEQETGIDIGTLIDLYNGYGYNYFKYDKTKSLINIYCKLHNKTFTDIKNEAEEAEYGKSDKWQSPLTESDGRSMFDRPRLNIPLIPNAVKLINDLNPTIVHSFEEYENLINKQRYFSASHSHCFYSKEEYDAWSKAGCIYTNKDSEKSDILKDCGDLVGVWDNKNKIGYVVPKEKSIKENLFIGDSIEIQDLITKLKTSLDVPYVNAYASTLGGINRASVMLTVSLDPKSEWPNGIKENSNYCNFRIDYNGKIEQFSGNLSRTLNFRKATAKSIDDIVGKINTYLNKVKELHAEALRIKANGDVNSISRYNNISIPKTRNFDLK